MWYIAVWGIEEYGIYALSCNYDMINMMQSLLQKWMNSVTEVNHKNPLN